MPLTKEQKDTAITGFVFKNASKTPLLCKQWCNEFWTFYLNGNNQWVTLSSVDEDYISHALNSRLSESEESLYPAYINQKQQ